MSSIRNRTIQPKQKYQVWWYPTNYPEGATPGWELKGAYEYPSEAFIARHELRQMDPQAEILCTCTIDFDVKIEQPIW